MSKEALTDMGENGSIENSKDFKYALENSTPAKEPVVPLINESKCSGCSTILIKSNS